MQVNDFLSFGYMSMTVMSFSFWLSAFIVRLAMFSILSSFFKFLLLFFSDAIIEGCVSKAFLLISYLWRRVRLLLLLSYFPFHHPVFYSSTRNYQLSIFLTERYIISLS